MHKMGNGAGERSHHDVECDSWLAAVSEGSTGGAHG